MVPYNATEEVLQALRVRTFPLETMRAGTGFDDLQPLRSILKDKRVVALGEATHHGIDPVVGQRDAVMAENVAETLAQAGPEGKMVLWVHNRHISNTAGLLGHYLKQHWYTLRTSWLQLYDGTIYIEESTPALGMP